MFKFLKDKLKESIAKISGKIEEEAKEEIIEEAEEGITPEPKIEEKKESPQEKKSFFAKLKEKFSKKDELEPEEELEAEELPYKSEIEEIQKEREIKKEEEQLKQKDEKIQKRLEKQEIPSIQELTERKKHIEKIKEIKKEDSFEEEFEESGKKSFFAKLKEKVVTKKISEKEFDELFWELELALLENNVAVEVIEKIKQDLKNNLVDKPIRRGKVEETIDESLKKSINELFDVESFNLLQRVSQKKPFVICFVGINGSGKTTTIAKMAKLFLDNNLSVVLAAADTFRAASIEQIQMHGDRLGIKVIKHNYGSDPAAVAFDAVKHAQAKDVDVVLIDTAGRMHSNQNLQDEMKKIIRVAKPDLKIFVGESITGNDCVEQAQQFNEAIDIDAIILAKADVDEKGGAAISVSYVTKKPIIYIGTGQEYSDLEEFDPAIVIGSLGLEG